VVPAGNSSRPLARANAPEKSHAPAFSAIPTAHNANA